MDLISTPIKEALVTANKETRSHELGAIFWVQRADGTYIPAQEKEAWEMLRGRIRIGNKPVKFKYIGRSDGQLYWSEYKKLPEVFKEGQQKAKEFIREIEEKERAKADPNFKPRNFDILGGNGQPTNLNVGGLI